MNRHLLIAAAAVFLYASGPGKASDWSQKARSVSQARLSAKPRTYTHPSVGMAEDGVSADRARRIIAGEACDSPQNGMLIAAADTQEGAGETESSDQPATTTQEAEIERGPLCSFGETVKRDVHDMWHDLWHDTKSVYLNPWNVVYLVGAGGASLALRPEVDDDFEDHYRHSHTFSKGFRNFLDAAGSPATGFIVAGTWYLAGQVMQQDKTYEVGKRLASVLIITDLSTVLLKVSANTRAPNDLRFAWPSGHMSSTMALATVLNDAYGPIVGVPMYAFTAFLGIERLDDREHHFSDVIFGTALGWLVAHQVIKEHRPEIFGGELIPYVDSQNGCSGIAWLKTLGN